MSQQEALEFLKENKGKWFSSKEIAREITKNHQTIIANLKKLRTTDFLKVKNATDHNNKYLYKYNSI